MIESWSSRRLAGDLLRRIPTAAHLLHTVMWSAGTPAALLCTAVNLLCPMPSSDIRTMSLSTCTKLCERRERNDGRRQEEHAVKPAKQARIGARNQQANEASRSQMPSVTPSLAGGGARAHITCST